ncbi:MAG: hypothetical protein ACOY0T_18150 [Myxococcota bacterium]
MKRLRVAHAVLGFMLSVSYSLVVRAETETQTSSTAAPEAPEAQPEVKAEPLPMQSGGVVATRPSEPLAPVAAPAGAISHQRHVALLLTGLASYGLGASFATPNLGVELGFGYTPILATYSRDARDTPDFHFISSFEFSAVPFFEFYRVSPRTTLGAAAGYRYNNVLEHGVQAALFIRYDLSPRWALHLFIGPLVYPRAEARIRKHEGLPAGGSVSSGIAALHGLFAASLALYP